ncbi:hypothetical protein H253_1657 [Klebsiella pneumoniae KP-7]|nr:hypothetical protein H253_1657 [Klebsiella pneumoniae KP-7]
MNFIALSALKVHWMPVLFLTLTPLFGGCSKAKRPDLLFALTIQ